MPRQPFRLEPGEDVQTGLADWELIEGWPIEIKSIRMVRIGKGATGIDFDWTTNDALILKMFAQALAPGRMTRSAFSDFITLYFTSLRYLIRCG